MPESNIETPRNLETFTAVLDFCRYCDNLREDGTCSVKSVTLEDQIRFVNKGGCSFAKVDGIEINMTAQGPQLK